MAHEFRCTRCGDCCRGATSCDIRGWITGQVHFTAPCDQFVENGDGTTSCKGIIHAIEHPELWHSRTRQWLLEEFIGAGCEKKCNREE